MTSEPAPRVLIADDQMSNVLIMTAALKDEFDVVAATTSAEVFERADAGIDLILLDIVMPGVDGFEICRRLKSDARTASIPVIFVTGLENSADETHGFDCGAVDYITKPIRPSIVRARVRTHVELKRARDLLERLASIDPLTGVANRRRFDAAVDEEWRRTARAGRWLSMAMVDVDHFKAYNDLFGHPAGDARLRDIAASLVRTARRAGDLVARYGGEEFGIILPELEPAMMHGVVRAMLAGVAGSGPNAVTISVGAISIVPPHGLTSADALATADRLLYEAKSAGRDRAVHLDLSTNEKLYIART